MARVYSRDDSGAPTFAFNTGQSNIAHFTALKTILKACLVSGYGSKPAAGWLLIAEGDRYLVLRNGPASGYVCLTWTGATCSTVYLAATYTGVSGDVMVGAGLKSGSAAGLTAPQRFYIGVLAYSSANTTWYVVADEKTFYLQGAGGGSVFEFASSDYGAMTPLYVGEDSEGNFLAMGGRNSPDTPAYNHFNHLGVTVLRDPATGLLVDGGAIDVVAPGLALTPSHSGTGTAVLTSVTPLLEAPLCPVRWGTSVLAGRLRGQTLCPLVAMHYPSPAAKCLGHVGALTSRNCNTPLPLGGAHTHLIGINYAGSATRIVTDNPEFW